MRPIGGVMRGAGRCVAALAGALAEPVSPSLVSDGDSKPPLVTRLPPSAAFRGNGHVVHEIAVCEVAVERVVGRQREYGVIAVRREFSFVFVPSVARVLVEDAADECDRPGDGEMLGVGAVIAGAVPVALVAVDRSVAQGGGAELERAFAAVGELSLIHI